MKATGIIAEYNPLHLGHLYHIKKASEAGDPVVVVLSSDFTQRGEPAFTDKESRAMMALKAGADLVLELPVLFSCHNAGVFASGALDILAKTGIVGGLSFGMETWPPNTEATLDILVEEPKPFKDSLRSFLDEGFSFVQARAMAAEKLIPGSSDFLSKPNNSLGASYMVRIAQKSYPIRPIPIQRIGGGYHDCGINNLCPSSTAIRNSIRSGDLRAMESLPKSSREILRSEMAKGRCLLDHRRLWEYLKFLLIRTDRENLKSHAEFSEGIENRFLTFSETSGSWEEFIAKCSCKRYPKSRLQRNMIHFLTGLRHRENRLFQEKGPAYIKPLGASKRGRELLAVMKEKASLPIVTGYRGIKKDPYGLEIMAKEQKACDIWELLIPKGEPGRDKRTPPIMI